MPRLSARGPSFAPLPFRSELPRRLLPKPNDADYSFFGSVLSQNLSLLRSRCRQDEGTIIVIHGGNHAVTTESRDRMRMEIHSSLNDWEFMALLPDGMLRRLIGMQRAIADHNFDIDRAGTFAVDTWRESVIGRLHRIDDEANALRGLATMLERSYALPKGDVNAPGIADD